MHPGGFCATPQTPLHRCRSLCLTSLLRPHPPMRSRSRRSIRAVAPARAAAAAGRAGGQGGARTRRQRRRQPHRQLYPDRQQGGGRGGGCWAGGGGHAGPEKECRCVVILAVAGHRAPLRRRARLWPRKVRALPAQRRRSAGGLPCAVSTRRRGGCFRGQDALAGGASPRPRCSPCPWPPLLCLNRPTAPSFKKCPARPVRAPHPPTYPPTPHPSWPRCSLALSTPKQEPPSLQGNSLGTDVGGRVPSSSSAATAGGSAAGGGGPRGWGGGACLRGWEGGRGDPGAGGTHGVPRRLLASTLLLTRASRPVPS